MQMKREVVRTELTVAARTGVIGFWASDYWGQQACGLGQESRKP